MRGTFSLFEEFMVILGYQHNDVKLLFLFSGHICLYKYNFQKCMLNQLYLKQAQTNSYYVCSAVARYR